MISSNKEQMNKEKKEKNEIEDGKLGERKDLGGEPVCCLTLARRVPHQGQEKHVELWSPEVAAWGNLDSNMF